MAYADSIRTTAPTMGAVASLIEGICSSSGNLVAIYYLPTISVTAPFTFTVTSIPLSKYFQVGKIVFFTLSFSGTAGGTLSSIISIALPVTSPGSNICAACTIVDNSTYKAGAVINNGTTTLEIRKYDASNYTAGSVSITVYGFYEAV